LLFWKKEVKVVRKSKLFLNLFSMELDAEAGTTFGMGTSMDRDPGRVAGDGSEALILGT